MHGSFPWFFLIPVIAVVGGMIIGAIAIITDHRRRQALLLERRLMIEKGMTPPALTSELLSDEKPAGTVHAIESSLRSGIILVFTGLGLFAAFLVMRYLVGEDGSFIPLRVVALLGPAGALVALIGVGNLLYFRIASRRASST
jgi:ABC-type uncharacterized transport system permease subunit